MVPADKLWGAQTQRSITYFSIGVDLMPAEMIDAYAILKKACAIVNQADGRLPKAKADLIVRACDEILAGEHRDMFPLHVWMTGSGTQFNMNVNEVISNRCCQLAGHEAWRQEPVHPNDDVNMSQSSNDYFPTAMHIAAAGGVTGALIPAVQSLRDGLNAKAEAWAEIIKIGRTHLQDATPLTLGQEFSGYVAMLDDNLDRLAQALSRRLSPRLGRNGGRHRDQRPARFRRRLGCRDRQALRAAFVTAPNKFAAQGAHDALVHLSATLKTLAVSFYKIANDIRLLSCGPRAGLYELIIPANEPGSSIMPGKVNPTQCEALTMVAAQVIGNDVAVALGGAGGQLEMNVYKPLIIHNVMGSIASSPTERRTSALPRRGHEAERRSRSQFVSRSLMLVTAPRRSSATTTPRRSHIRRSITTCRCGRRRWRSSSSSGRVRPSRRSGDFGAPNIPRN